jgi:NTP pyrophosphatase (non-canonical NTP hydrolase)
MNKRVMEAALGAAGEKIIALETQVEHERERWRDTGRRYGELRKRMHDEGTAVVMNLDELQVEMFAWQTRNFGEQPAHLSFLGVVEEVGELAHAILKHEQGVRGTPEEHTAEAKDAIGDAMIFLLNFCQTKGWSLEEIVRSTWAEVSRRDWQRFPKNGLTE